MTSMKAQKKEEEAPSSFFTPYISIAKAVSQLFHPHVEVVIHDLSTRTIVAIFGTFSGRKPGDSSEIEELPSYSHFPEVFPPYLKTNPDGRLIKSTTVTLFDPTTRTPQGLLCINVDISMAETLFKLTKAFIETNDRELSLPEELFSIDVREKIASTIRKKMNEIGSTREAMSTSEKRHLIETLHKEGVFSMRHAVPHVASLLGISRATIYSYLKNTPHSHK